MDLNKVKEQLKMIEQNQEQLKAHNAELRSANEQLSADNATLKASIADLQSKAASGDSGVEEIAGEIQALYDKVFPADISSENVTGDAA